MKKTLLFAAFWCIGLLKLGAQSAYAPIDRDYYHLIDRYAILNNEAGHNFQSTFKPYRKDAIAAYLDLLEMDSLVWGKVLLPSYTPFTKIMERPLHQAFRLFPLQGQHLRPSY
jgi:hypothetical protein